MGAPPTVTVSLPRRDPSAAAAPQVLVSVRCSSLPTKLLTKSGSWSVGMARLLTMTVSAPRAVIETECESAPVAAALRSWKAWSLSMAKTRSGVAA